MLGVGAAATTLAQATPRRPVRRALDVGTGCGVQALHLSRHAEAVVATDISDRALRMAATTAALNGLGWELRRGHLLAPVGAETFDLVVSNPPFVVGPGPGADGTGLDYRDSGLAGDEVSRRLLSGLPALLAEDGTAQLLANWELHADQAWDERLAGWIAGTGCDAWVWQREVVDPARYVTLWLRDAGLEADDPGYLAAYDQWLDWFEAAKVAGVGMGLVTLRRSGSAHPVVVCEDVPQAMQLPVGDHVEGWLSRARWLADHDDAAMAASRLIAASDLILSIRHTLGEDGWAPARTSLESAGGMRWQIEADALAGRVVAGCRGALPLGQILALLAASVGVPAHELSAAAMPVVRDLVGRGLLLPPGRRGAGNRRMRADG